jgi:hypothetical protein
MTMEPDNDGGKPRRETNYASKPGSGAKPGFALSAWSLVVGAIFLALILGGLLVI